MKNIFLLILLSVISFSCCGSKKIVNETQQSIDTVYDEILVKKLGADDYGMKKYIIAFLKKGPYKSIDSTAADKLQRAHLDNITKLAKEGKLVLAGPFLGNEDLRGIYIFNVETIEEAKKLTQSDPAIHAGILTMELKEWYGSAALILLNDLHKKVSKIEI